MSKAQISVEFFLVLAVIIAFTIILYANAKVQVDRSLVLQHAVIAQSLVDSFASSANFVYFSGPGAKITKDFYVPPETACFYVEAAGTYVNRVYCTLLSGELPEMLGNPATLPQSVYSQELVFTGYGVGSKFDWTDCALPLQDQNTNWFTVEFYNDATGKVKVTCS